MGKSDKQSSEGLRMLALSLMQEQREHEMNSGWPDWKATIFALSSVRSLIERFPLDDNPDIYASELINALDKQRVEYNDSDFNDEYGAAKGAMGSFISKLRENFPL